MLRFCDSFDHYGTADIGLKWQIVSGSPTIASGGRTNKKLTMNLQFFSATGLNKTIDNQSTWTIGAAINWTKNSVATGFMGLDDASTRQVSLTIDSSGLLYLDKNGSNIANSGSNTWVDGWNYVEMKCVFNGSSGAVTVRVNGATWITYSGNISQSGNDRANIVFIGDHLGGNHSAPALGFDDFYACDAQGSTNTTFLGDVTVDALTPNAAGNYSNWTANGSTFGYNCVNENPTDGDTTYISDTNVGDRESFTFTAPTNTILTVYGVQFVTDMKKSWSGNRSIGTFTRTSSTNYDQTGVAISTTYAMYTTILETNPATSAAWTSTDIAGIEAGVKVTL